MKIILGILIVLTTTQIGCYGQSGIPGSIELATGNKSWQHQYLRKKIDDKIYLSLPLDSIDITLTNMSYPDKKLSFKAEHVQLSYYLYKTGGSLLERRTITKDGECLPDGGCLLFDSEGNLTQVSVWKLGKLIRVTSFSKDGSISSTHTY